MLGNKGVKICGTGMFVPPRVVTNKDLEKIMDTTDEWIVKRSGIRERRYVDDGVMPSDIAAEASKRAIEAAGLKAEDIDMIVLATLSPENFFPGTSVFLQKKLGLESTPAMDVRCQCSGFLYGLSVAKAFISSGQYEKVLLCCVEVHSRGLLMSDKGRDTAVLFGDGAGALVLQPSDDPERGILSVHLHAEGEHADKLRMEAPGMAKMPYISHEDIDEGTVWPSMDGRFVFKNAVKRMPEVINEALKANSLTGDDVNLFLLHQANIRINEAAMKQLKQPLDKAYNNIDRYGNCSAASIPMLIDECVKSKRIKDGDLICMASFGSGFTWASALIRW